jgi:hypothetical protein
LLSEYKVYAETADTSRHELRLGVFYRIVLKLNLKTHLSKAQSIHFGEELRTTSKLGLALEVLRDGEWHGMEELQQLLELNQSQAAEIVSFLHEYNLAAIDDQNKRVRIQKYFQEFLAQTSTC